jgi:hypothetical protein
MIKLVGQVSHQYQIERAAPVLPRRIGVLPCDRKDGLPANGRNLRAYNDSCDRNDGSGETSAMSRGLSRMPLV